MNPKSVIGLLQPLLGHLRSNDVTSGHLRWRDVIFCHLIAMSCELKPSRSWNASKMQVFGLLQPLPSDFRSNNVTSGSLPVTCHVTSFPVTWLSTSGELQILYELGFYSHFQVTSGQMTPLPGHFRSPEVTWHHLLSPDCHPLWATAL